MFRNIFLVVAIFFTNTLFSQENDTLPEYLENLYQQEQYDSVIAIAEKYTIDELNSFALYYAGLAHYQKKNDQKAHDYFNASIYKNPFFSDVYYYNGLLLNLHEDYDNAIKHFRAALKLKPRESDYSEGLAEAFYFKGEMDSALVYLKRAEDYGGLRGDIYMKMGDIYLKKGNQNEAISAYYRCLYKSDPNSDQYDDCLYNLAYFEYEEGNYKEAELALATLLNRNPDDYKAIEKMIQTYFKLGKGYKVRDLRQSLYNAHRNNELPESMSDMYCFDEFEYRDFTIKGCEKFAELRTGTVSKHVFYVMNTASDSLMFTIQTEQDEKIRQTNHSYYLAKIQNDKKYIYYNLLYPSVIDYDKMVKDIKDVIANKVEPTKVVEVQQ